jgi:hypothetical protein
LKTYPPRGFEQENITNDNSSHLRDLMLSGGAKSGAENQNSTISSTEVGEQLPEKNISFLDLMKLIKSLTSEQRAKLKEIL